MKIIKYKNTLGCLCCFNIEHMEGYGDLKEKSSGCGIRFYGRESGSCRTLYFDTSRDVEEAFRKIEDFIKNEDRILDLANEEAIMHKDGLKPDVLAPDVEEGQIRYENDKK